MKIQVSIFTALIFLQAVSLKAQSFVFNAEVAGKIKSTILLVSIQSEDPLKIKKFSKKPELLEVYKEQITTTNYFWINI